MERLQVALPPEDLERMRPAWSDSKRGDSLSRMLLRTILADRPPKSARLRWICRRITAPRPLVLRVGAGTSGPDCRNVISTKRLERMKFTNWLKSRFFRSQKARRMKQGYQWARVLEQLEDRAMLATLYVDSSPVLGGAGI